MQEWRDGVGTKDFEGEDGFLGRDTVEASGSGGQGAGSGEYEEILDVGRDEENAYVDVFLIKMWPW